MKRAKKYIRQDDALAISQFAWEDKERDRGINDRRRDIPKKRLDKGLEALNKHRWERKD